MSGRAACYLRISQDRTGQQAGVTRQEEDCRALASRHGLDVVDVITDNDTSAYSTSRPGYAALVDAMKAGRVTDVVVWHTDRLYRRPRDLEDLVDLIEATGTQIHTVRAGRVDLSTAAGRLQARMLGAVAAYEGEIKGERIARAAQQRAHAGRFSGGMRPYGYEPDGVTVRDPEAAALRRAFADVTAGVSLREITRRLNSDGVTTSTGKPWKAAHLRSTLLSPRLAGLATYHDAIVGPAGWPPIVDEATWHAARRILTAPDRRTTPGPTPRHLLSGIAVCGRDDCGKPCRVSKTGGQGRPARYRYRCPHGHVIRDRALLESYVVDVTLALLEREHVTATTTPTATTTAAGADEVRARLDDLAAAFAAGEITREQMATASTTLRARLDHLEAQLAATTRRDHLADVTGPGARAAWDALPLDRRRAVLRAVWGTIPLAPMPSGRRGVTPDGVHLVPVWAKQ